MSIFTKDHKSEISKQCKGRFYRAKVNSYFSSGVLRTDRRLVLLKRMSCKGCDDCYWIDEHLREEYYKQPLNLDHIKHGKLYTFSFSGGQYLPYWGDYDDIYTEVIEVENEFNS